MASSAIAVLPVWRSPMISSRWPRPIGISASIALRPVAIGSLTDLRGMMPGALTSTRLRSDGLDRALAVDRIAERIDHAAEQALAHRRIDDGAGALDGLAFLDLAVGAEDHDADVVGFEVQRHAAGAVLELDHLAGLDVVEAVDAGDAVADGQHLSDFGNFSLLAEILDLVLEDRGNFRGADVHQPASFIACLIELSLVRSELSTMRLPSLTTRPPMMEGSTFTLSATSLPVTDFSAAFRASRFLSLSFSATVTSAVASPLNLATSARKARITSATANSRRLAVRTFRKFAEMPVIPALSSTAASAFDCASGGEYRAADQPFQIGAVGQHGVEFIEIGLYRVDGFFIARQFEQGRCITAGHSRNGRIFSSHKRALFSCQTRKGKTVATMRRLAIQALGIQAGLRFSTGTSVPASLKSRLC